MRFMREQEHFFREMMRLTPFDRIWPNVVWLTFVAEFILRLFIYWPGLLYIAGGVFLLFSIVDIFCFQTSLPLKERVMKSRVLTGCLILLAINILVIVW